MAALGSWYTGWSRHEDTWLDLLSSCRECGQQMVSPSGSTSAAEPPCLRACLSLGSQHSVSEPGGGIKTWPFQPNTGWLPWIGFIPELPRGLAEAFSCQHWSWQFSLSSLASLLLLWQVWSLVNVMNSKLYFNMCFWRPRLVTWGFSFPICKPWKPLAWPFADVGGSWISVHSLPCVRAWAQSLSRIRLFETPQ